VSGTLLAIGLGALAGVLSGLFGVGGGIIFVPVLTLAIGLHQLDAQATSLAAAVPVVVTGTLRQHSAGLVRWRAALVIGACSLAGVAVGSIVATHLSESTLRRVFGLVLLTAAIQVALAARRHRPADAPGG
jgi:uncharacterized membrane protein YfcA